MPISKGTEVARLAVEIRSAGLDAWSDIRSLHATSFRALAGPYLEPAQVAAFIEWVYSPDYTDLLMTRDLQAAWYNNHLVGTAGWVPTDDSGTSARITAVFVAPLFARLGIGRALVEAAEGRARAAGFPSFSARVLPPALAFFEALGYRRSSQGALAFGTENGIPVTFMRKWAQPARRAHDDPVAELAPYRSFRMI